MKRITLICILLFASVVTVSCTTSSLSKESLTAFVSSEDISTIEESSQIETLEITEPVLEVEEEINTQIPEQETKPEEELPPSVQQAPVAESTSEPSPNTEATYIDGILIVNKTYSIPKDFGAKALTTECLNAFLEMQKGASADGLFIFVNSGYRSYYDQEYMYNLYCNRDGKEAADTFSARPGHSEHQTGLAIDVNSCEDAFAFTKEAEWLKNNCSKYGFIIRYPEGKSEITGYKYEPWHVRYVGVELAEELYLDNGEFTTLEEHFGITSQYSE